MSTATSIPTSTPKTWRIVQLVGAMMFIIGLPLLLGLNGGSVPLAITGMVVSIVGVCGFLVASPFAAPIRPRVWLSESEQNLRNLVVVGWLMVIIFPIGGFVAGAVLLSRRAGSGAAMMMLSVVSAWAWFVLVGWGSGWL